MSIGRMPLPRFVAGSMGPTTRSITVTRNVTFQDLRDGYYLQAKALLEGGADVLLLETCNDTRNVKAALLGIERAEKELGFEAPVMVSGTIEPMGTMLAGQTADAFYASIGHRNLLSVGLNCATGPEFMTDHIRTLHEMANTRISCYPNAGLPNEEMKYLETPETFAAQLEKFVDHGWLNLVGGCCGTTPAHIRAIAQMVEGKKPREIRANSHKAYYSGIELVEADESNRPLIVGERTNVIGSRAFKNLIAEEKWEEATEIARRQVQQRRARRGCVSADRTDRDEMKDIPPFYEKLIRKLKVADHDRYDRSEGRRTGADLFARQGVDQLDQSGRRRGEVRAIVPGRKGLWRGVGRRDDRRRPVQAQAFTRERKLAVAQRSVELLTEKYGIPAEDIILDPLVFPCATGDENYMAGLSRRSRRYG